MNVLEFLIRPRSDLDDVIEVVPAIDGEELTDLIHRFERAAEMETRDVSYGGLIPSYFRFGRLRHHYLAEGDAFVNDRGKVPLLGCECGEWGCWPLLAAVRRTDETITGEAFEQPHRPKRDYSAFGPFVFDRSQYEAALAVLEEALGT